MESKVWQQNWPSSPQNRMTVWSHAEQPFQSPFTSGGRCNSKSRVRVAVRKVADQSVVRSTPPASVVFGCSKVSSNIPSKVLC